MAIDFLSTVASYDIQIITNSTATVYPITKSPINKSVIHVLPVLYKTTLTDIADMNISIFVISVFSLIFFLLSFLPSFFISFLSTMYNSSLSKSPLFLIIYDLHDNAFFSVPHKKLSLSIAL